MEPFGTAKQVLTWLCILPADETSSKRARKIRTIFSVAIFIFLLYVLVGFLTFILKNISTSFEDCLMTFITGVNFAGVNYTMIIGFYSRYRVPTIFERLTAIYKASELCKMLNANA